MILALALQLINKQLKNKCHFVPKMGFSILQRGKTTFMSVLLDTYPSHKTFCYFRFISCLPRRDRTCQITGVAILVGTFCPYNVGNTRHTQINAAYSKIIGFFGSFSAIFILTSNIIQHEATVLPHQHLTLTFSISATQDFQLYQTRPLHLC